MVDAPRERGRAYWTEWQDQWTAGYGTKKEKKIILALLKGGSLISFDKHNINLKNRILHHFSLADHAMLYGRK